jgi:hypothetical protein
MEQMVNAAWREILDHAEVKRQPLNQFSKKEIESWNIYIYILSYIYMQYIYIYAIYIYIHTYTYIYCNMNIMKSNEDIEDMGETPWTIPSLETLFVFFGHLFGDGKMMAICSKNCWYFQRCFTFQATVALMVSPGAVWNIVSKSYQKRIKTKSKSYQNHKPRFKAYQIHIFQSYQKPY